jgi:hypothetical protein
MTPNQLIDDLKLPHHEIDRIKALKASFEEFERILRGSIAVGYCPPTPFHHGLEVQVENCVTLIAKILNQDRNTILQALLALFGVTENQLKTTSGTVLQIVAFSALVEAQRH